eukprot:6959917-Alexandrium_andersonii.AAC.1
MLPQHCVSPATLTAASALANHLRQLPVRCQAVAVITSYRTRVSERPAALLTILPLAVSVPLARHALSGCDL